MRKIILESTEHHSGEVMISARSLIQNFKIRGNSEAADTISQFLVDLQLHKSGLGELTDTIYHNNPASNSRD